MPDELKITRGSGTVMTNDSTIVLDGLPKIVEYTFDTVPRDLDLTKYKIYESYEGSYIRVFFYNGNWYTATLNKLNIFKGNFGKVFMESLCAALNVDEHQDDDHETLFQSMFNPEIKYTFLVKPYEKLVSDIDPLPQNRIIMIEGDLNLPKRKELTYSSIDEMLSHFKCDYRVSQGLVLIGDNECIKIYDNEYYRIKKVRGNAKSLIVRYLEVRCTEHLDEFLRLFPDMKPTIVILEEQIYSLAKHLHNLYMQMFVKNNCTLKYSREEKLILHCIHRNYISTKQRTIPTRINDLLAQMHPLKLNRLLKIVFGNV
jgi:hypothetical protein